MNVKFPDFDSCIMAMHKSSLVCWKHTLKYSGVIEYHVGKLFSKKLFPMPCPCHFFPNLKLFQNRKIK